MNNTKPTAPPKHGPKTPIPEAIARQSSILEGYPDPDFIAPDFGPARSILRKDGTSGPMTAEESAFCEKLRQEQLARNAAIRAREGLPTDGSGDAEWNARRLKRKPVEDAPK
jgi:hypothetical protein